jgi:type IV secretory pathway ATPase VirB11/archaellum biosynthesis ATPase
MRSILILEPIGKMGSSLLQYLLDQEHWVTALVKKPSTVPIQHPKLEVLQGEQVAYRTLIRAMEGQELIIVCFQKTNADFGHEQNVLDAMAINHIRVLIVLKPVKSGRMEWSNVEIIQWSNLKITIYLYSYPVVLEAFNPDFFTKLQAIFNAMGTHLDSS